MQGRDDALGNDAGAKATWRPFGHTPRKDELHLVWTPQVQVFTDDVLKQDATREGTIQDLGEREFRLQNREVIPVAGATVLSRERMGQASQPFAQQAIDPFCRQPVTDRLQLGRVGTGQKAIIECGKGNAALCQLALGIFVAIDTEAGIVGKVGTELEKEGAEVPVNRIDVILVATQSKCSTWISRRWTCCRNG